MSLRNLIESSSSLHDKAESMAPQTSYATNLAGFTWGAVTFNQWIMGITLLLGVLTFVVNFYFQYRRNEREKELHGQRMAERRADPHRPDRSTQDA